MDNKNKETNKKDKDIKDIYFKNILQIGILTDAYKKVLKGKDRKNGK